MNQNPLASLFGPAPQTLGAPPQAQQPMPGQDPGQFQLQQGLAQLQGLTQVINQKHAELQNHIQQHTQLRKHLGL